MNTVEVKTADLIGRALDWAVAEVIQKPVAIIGGVVMLQNSSGDFVREFSPSTNWSQCGPLIEKYGLGIAKFYEPIDGPIDVGYEWAALWRDDSARMDGPTPLIAACRAIVAHDIGDTVMVPAELINGDER